MSCQDDSCELVHCSNCKSHTIGNSLIAGMCELCFELEQERDRRVWEIENQLVLRKLFGPKNIVGRTL